VGLHTMLLKMQPDHLQRLLDAGMNWLLNGSDIVSLRDSLNAQFGRLRELTAARAPSAAAASAAAPASATIQNCLT